MLNEKSLKTMKIAVIGVGVTGKAVADYLIKQEIKELILIDKNVEKAKSLYGELSNVSILSQGDQQSEEALLACDLAILSPGIPREADIFRQYLEGGGKLISEIELAYQLYFQREGNTKTKVVALTGSNGKTTTVSLLANILEVEGTNFFVGGNIGTPFISALMQDKFFDFILLELSSFQLESIEKFHPHVAAILNLYKNHGERYKSMEDYFKAKWMLTKNMEKGDLCFLPQNQPFFENKKNELHCETAFISLDKSDSSRYQFINEFELSKYRLLGEHNLINLEFTVGMSLRIGISRETIQKVINSFKGVEHRMEVCESRFPFMIINDAKSTNLDATLSALKSTPKNRDIYLIMGGRLRDSNEEMTLGEEEFSRVKKVFLIGEAAKKLQVEFEGKGIACENCGDLAHVVYKMQELDKNSVLLFSPAFPSFDQFKNYAERGNAFKKLIM